MFELKFVKIISDKENISKCFKLSKCFKNKKDALATI